MGRKTDVLLRGFRAAKCLTVLKLATARIKVLRNKRSISAKQMRGEIAQLLKSGQDAQVYITKADALIKQENMVACYDIIDQYCHAIISRFPMIEMQSTCPIDMKGPIATLIFAAPRCVELSELASIKEAFIAKYGKEFAAAATELRPDCGVDKQVIELLSTRPASGDMKLKLMKEICVENNVNWTPGEALAEPSTSMRVGSSKQPVKTEVEAVKVTEHVGSSKATLVEAASLRVSEAGRSNLSVGTNTALQGGSKHEGIGKSGIAAVEPLKPGVLATNASKSSSGTKHGLSPEKDVGKANASALQGLKGAASTGIPSVKSGLAAAGSLSGIAAVEPLKPVVLATDASKSSGTKHGLSPEKDVGKANASVSQSLKGAASTGIPSVKPGLAAAGSLKTGHGAVFSPNAFKINDTKDEGMGSASLTALQSLKGVVNTGTSSAISGSFKESKGEPVAKAEAYAQPVVDAQDGMSDSDTDSFVSVEEERFEDDAEGSSKGGAARSESFGKNSLQAPVEADVNGPSLIKKPSREARENSPSTERPHEDVYSKAISKKSSFAMESAQEDIFLKASSKNSLNTEEKPFRAESRKSSLGEEKSTVEISYEDMFLRAQNSSNTDILLEEKAFRADSRKSSLRENSPSIERPHEDVYSKASSKKSGFTMESAQEDMFLKASSKNSLNTEEKTFRAESKKSSLGEEKSTGLTMKISHEDMFLRASSKNSSNPDILLEEKAFRADSRKSSLREKQLAEEQSFKQVRENSLMKEQLEEEQHFEARVEEGVQRKDFLEDVSVGTTTESSVPQMLVEEYPSEERQNWMTTEDGLQGKGIIEDPSFVAITESSLAKNLVEMKKIESFSYGISAEEMSSGAGEEVAGKEAALNIKKSPESVSKQIDNVPSIGKGVQELAGSASLGALATPDDFAAAAKAIAAEAARLAVLDYAKRIAGSSAIPIDLTDLSKFGLDFEGESQVTKKLHFEGKSELFHSQHGGASTIDVIKGEASKVEIAVNDDEAINSDHAKMTLTKDESLQQPDMASGNDDINPFATGIDKVTNSLFSETGEDDSSSWANQTKPELMSKSGGFGPELMSKAGGFGQEEDHLDVFFRRKTPRFDEEGYSFVKVNPSFLEERVSYLDYDKKESISQDKFFVSTPVFDSFPERQSMGVEESSGSFKSPVFDDAGPEAYDASSFDDGLDKSTFSVGLSDKKRPQSPSNLKASASFDLEPEPSFDKVVDEEEQSSIEKRGSTQVGQLKWQSNKASEQATSGEASASDTSLGGARNPLSRRSRKQPQIIDEYAYASEIPGQAKLFTDGGLTSKRPEGSFNTLMQQQQKEQGRKDKYDAADKGNLRTKPAESFAYSSDAMSKRPSSSPKRVSNQLKSDFSKQNQPDRWDSTSSVEDRFPSIRTTKSPIRSSQLQKVPLEESDEDYYFAEEIGNSSAGSSTNRRTTKSPTRVPKQQLFPQGYDDGAEGYKFSNKPSRMPNFSQLDLVDDDSTEGEPVPRYKPFRQSDDLSKGTSASSAMYRQKPHRQQEDYRSETVHTEYVEVNGVGKSNPTGRPSARRRKQPDVEEEDLASSYKPSVQSSSSRPLSSRKKIEEDEPHLASRYKPSAQVDDLGRVSSSPMSGRRQRYQLPQDEEQEVLMEQYEQEEFYSMPLPDWRQGERHKEQKRVTRPLYGQKQDLRMEKGNSDSSTEDYEQQQEDQRRPSMLSEQEKQRRRLPAYGQGKQHRPLPLLQEYEQEERMPRPLYGRKQDLRKEKENLDSTIEDYEKQQEQWHPSMLYEQEQDGQEKQGRPLPPYRQEKQRRPSPPLYDQQEEFHSMTLPDWRQEERRKEKERMSRPLYGRKQDSRLEKEDLDLSIEDYEQHQEQLRHSSMLSEQEQGGQEKQRRRFSPYGQENLQRPLPPLQQYEQEEFYSMPSPVWQQEQQERTSRPLYGRSRLEKTNVDLENYGQQQEEQWRTSMSSEQEQDEQEKQRRPSPPYGRRPDLKPGKENSESWQQEKVRQEQQQPSSDHQQQQQSLAEEVVKQQQQGRENERLPSPTYLRHQEIQEEKKSPELLMEHYELQKEEQLDHSTALPEGKQEQDGQGNEKRPWPLHSKKQESKHEKESLESWQQQEVHYMQQDKPSFGRKQQSLAKEEGVKGQQDKAEIKEQFPARQSPSKDEGVKGSQERPEIKAQTPTRRPPSLPAKSTSQPLESSVSDPVLLATIPPPVKKPVVQPVPAATTLESSVSAPPSTSVPEVKGPKLPAQKLPSVEDLLPNFEAFRRARKGE